MQNEPEKSSLSDQELLEAISYEHYLNKKRVENEKYEAKFNFGKCRICSDEATGIHYGTSTCEGCKGFFKRSQNKFKNYICRGNNNCQIIAKQTKKCKYCRWNACMRAGMSVNTVRMGRIPNSMKEIKPKNNSNPTTSKENSDKKKSNLNFCTSLNFLLKLNKLDRYKKLADSSNIVARTYFSEKFLNTSNENQLIVFSLLRDKAFQLYIEETKEFQEQEQRALKLVESGYEQKKFEYDLSFLRSLRKNSLIFLESHAFVLYKIVNTLPGFDRLSKNDISLIMKRHFFSVLGIRTLHLFQANDYFLILDDKIQMNRNVFAFILGEKTRDKVFDFYLNLKSFNLTNQELSLLIPYFLSSSSDSLENPSLLKEIHEYYSRTLHYEFNLKKRSVEFINNFFKAVSTAPLVNKICEDINLNEIQEAENE